MDPNFMMDQELLRLLTSARQTKNSKNLSSVLGNLDNGLLAFLAGVPFAGSSSQVDMPLTASYANSADPVVQQILQQVNTGIDEYALRSWLTNKMANNDFRSQVADAGWQEEDLESLAVGLQREKAKGATADKDSWWAKAGITDPSEGYGPENVPLSEQEALNIADTRLAAKKSENLVSKARENLARAQRQAGSAYGAFGFDRFGNPKKPTSKELYNYLKNTEAGKKIVKERNIDLSSVDPETGVMYDWNISENKNRPWWNPKNLFDPFSTQIGRTAEMFVKEGVQGKRMKSLDTELQDILPDQEEIETVNKAKSELSSLEREGNLAAALEEATRRGRARAFNDAGRNPARDQLKQMLRFMTGT